jgi:hypothetical protein
MTFDPDLYLQQKQTSQEFNPDEYLSSKKSLLEKAKDFGLEALDTANEVIMRAGPNQLKNAYAGMIGQRPPIVNDDGSINTQEIADVVLGNNAPSLADIANKAGVPSFDINWAGPTENMKDFGTTPRLSEQETAELRKVPTGYNTNDVLGFLGDMALGDKSVNNLIKIGKAAPVLVKRTDDVIPNKISSSSQAYASQSQSGSASAQSSAKAGATIEGGGAEANFGGQLFEKKAPQTLDELREWKPAQEQGNLLGKKRLAEIEQIVPDLETKPLKYHYDMMENPKSMKDLKLTFENLPTDDAKKIAAYNQSIVDESGKKTLETIKSISGSEPVSLVQAGDDFIEAAGTKYNETKGALGPVFKELKQNAKPLSNEQTLQLAQKISAETNIGKLLEVDPKTFKLSLGKNSPKTGISPEEYGHLQGVVDDLNGGLTWEEIQKTRETLRKVVDPSNSKNFEELQKVRGIFLDEMEKMAEGLAPNVRDTFKAFAINERNREIVENVIGGKIEDFNKLYRANPERVAQKVFSNPNNAKIVAEYVGPEVMDKLVQAKIADGVSKAFDSAKGFNPVALRNWLSTNRNFMNNYAGQEVTERLSALADYGFYGKRFLDEVNPSGTAASLLAAIEPKGFFGKVRAQGIKGAVVSETAGRVEAKLNQKQAVKALSQALGEQAPTVKKSYDFSKLKQIKESLPSKAEAARVSGNAAVGYGMAKEGARVAEDKSDYQAKWILNGIKKLQGAGVYADLEKIKGDPQIKDLLIRAGNAQNEEQLKRISEQIRNTEAFKKAPKGGPKTSNKYPMTLRQNGFKVTVKNDQDYYEAKSEGWA